MSFSPCTSITWFLEHCCLMGLIKWVSELKNSPPRIRLVVVHTLAHPSAQVFLPSFTPLSVTIFLHATLLSQGCDLGTGGKKWVFCLKDIPP